MSIEVGQVRIPMRWTMQDGREISRGMTLTEFAALENGLMELVRMRRWAKRAARMAHFERTLIEALSQEHLYEQVRAIEEKLNAAGARRGRARAIRAIDRQELMERQVEYGILPG